MFIDGNNYYNSTNELLGEDFKVDLYQLLLDVRDHFQKNYYPCYFDRAFYFSALPLRTDNPEKYDEHKSFLGFISKFRFLTVKEGFLAKRPKTKDIPIDINDDGTYYYVEKETDVNLSNEMLESAFNQKYDVGLLFAADGDYADTLIRLREYPVEIFAVLPDGAPSGRIQNVLGSHRIIRLPKDFYKRQKEENKTIISMNP